VPTFAHLGPVLGVARRCLSHALQREDLGRTKTTPAVPKPVIGLANLGMVRCHDELAEGNILQLLKENELVTTEIIAVHPLLP
jgi:hypothetical protein